MLMESALGEWAYGFTYQNSAHRTAALDYWNHHYNWHRPHRAFGGATPMSRLKLPGNNLFNAGGYDLRLARQRFGSVYLLWPSRGRGESPCLHVMH